jgi:competence protein ComEC
MASFKSIPLLKIIFPYLLGILFVLQFGILPATAKWFVISTIFVLITFIVYYLAKNKTGFKKIIYITSINAFLFILAHQSFYLYNAKNDLTNYTQYVSSKQQQSVVVISEVPVVTEKGLKLAVNLKYINANSKWKTTTGKTIIYLKKDSLNTYNVGDYLFLNTKWSYITEPKNPNEFNYKRYLENKNIFNIIYSDSKHVLKYNGFGTDDSYILIGEKIKSKIVNSLRNSNLSENAFSICSALLVGFDDEINKDVLTSFSHSGTLHILSVSGMHTGVICGIILFIFSYLDKNNKHKKIKCVVIITVLFLFTTITGFSPSVLRASLMLSLIILGKTFQKQSNSYNTLLLSAFILLIVNPLLIIDVGFLLSYFAVFGIMYLFPILDSLLYVENKILKWFWSSCLISIAATIFTLPITLYFFHQFPIWFVFSNLVIIPISLLVMLFALCVVVFTKVLFLKSLFVVITNASVSLMIYFSNLTDNSNYGYIDNISFDKLDVMFLSLLIVSVLILISNKQFNYVVASLCICISWMFLTITQNYTQLKQHELIVFNVKQKSFFAIRIGNNLYCDLNKITKSDFERYIKPYLLSYKKLTLIDSKKQCITINNSTFINLTSTKDSPPKIDVNFILISNNSLVNLTDFKDSKPLIIVDGSNTYKTITKLKKQCASNHLKFYNVKENGALILNAY